MPGALSSAKYTREGELFARLKLEDVLSEDSMAGRLILQNAQIAWVAPAVDTSDGNKEMRKVGRHRNIFFMLLKPDLTYRHTLILYSFITSHSQTHIHRAGNYNKLPSLDIPFHRAI